MTVRSEVNCDMIFRYKLRCDIQDTDITISFPKTRENFNLNNFCLKDKRPFIKVWPHLPLKKGQRSKVTWKLQNNVPYMPSVQRMAVRNSSKYLCVAGLSLWPLGHSTDLEEEVRGLTQCNILNLYKVRCTCC